MASASISSSKTGLQEAVVAEVRLNGCRKEDVPLVEEDQVRKHLSKLNIYVFGPFS